MRVVIVASVITLLSADPHGKSAAAYERFSWDYHDFKAVRATTLVTPGNRGLQSKGCSPGSTCWLRRTASNEPKVETTSSRIAEQRAH